MGGGGGPPSPSSSYFTLERALARLLMNRCGPSPYVITATGKPDAPAMTTTSPLWRSRRRRQARRKKQRAKQLLGRMGLPATRGLDADAAGGELGAEAVVGGPAQQTFVLTRAGPDHPAVSSEGR